MIPYLYKKCLSCGKKFGARICEIKRGRGLYCSKKCKYGITKIEKRKNYCVMQVKSKKHGNFEVKFDLQDFDRVVELGGKWCVSVPRNNNLIYFQKRIDRKHILLLHRYLIDAPGGTVVDHINRNTLDNRRQNLRICPNSANCRNGDAYRNNTSGYRGVSWIKSQPWNPWIARIKVKYKSIFLGSFSTFGQAVKARKTAEINYWSV